MAKLQSNQAEFNILKKKNKKIKKKNQEGEKE